MRIKGFAFLVGTMAAGLMLPGCLTGPLHSPNPLGHPNPHRDLATQEQYPLRSAPDKEEVDRRFEEHYPGTVNWLWVWGRDRWFDLLDVVSWDIGFGRGFGVNAHLTEFAQAGTGWWDGSHWGMRGRTWGVWDEHRNHRGLGPFYWIEVERTPQWGTKTVHGQDYKYTGWDLFEKSSDKRTDNDWSEVGGNANILAIGARAAASPVEVLDFAAGLFPPGLIANVMGYHHPVFDVMGDDTWADLHRVMLEERGLGGE